MESQSNWSEICRYHGWNYYGVAVTSASEANIDVEYKCRPGLPSQKPTITPIHADLYSGVKDLPVI